MLLVKFWFSISVSEGKSKLCQRIELDPSREITRLDVLDRETLSPSVPVDQNTPACGSEITRLPWKKTRVLSDHLAGLVGLASHKGSEDGTWITARASWTLLTRRKPSE